MKENIFTLIIGCGNSYKDHHKYHANCFTIDMNKNLNPTLVCELGKEETNLQNNYFNKIIFEGLFPFAINTEIGINEIKRISKDVIDIEVTMIENNHVIILSKRNNFNRNNIDKKLFNDMTNESQIKIENLEKN